MVREVVKRTLKWTLGGLIPILLTLSLIRPVQAEIPPEDRISKILLQVAAEMQREQPDLESLPGSEILLFDENQESVGVTITAINVNQLIPLLETQDFDLVGSSSTHHFLEGYIPLDKITTLADFANFGLMSVRPAYRPEIDVGAVTSQADVVHEADRVRLTAPGNYDGTGINIGVMSDSYDNLGTAAADVASGDLPATVTIRDELGSGGGSDEGRAMMQLAYDLAPGADYAFATAFSFPTTFRDNILDLAAWGADIIVDDVVYLEEPFFQDGIIAQAVDTVFASGTAYFSSAGNRDTAAYESTSFNGSPDNITGVGAVTAHDFDPGPGVDTRQRVTVGSGSTTRLALQWDDPWYTVSGVDTDLDIYLLNTSGSEVASATENSILSQTPSELLSYLGPGNYDVVIVLAAGPAPGRIKYVNFGPEMTGVEFATNSPTVNPHAAAAGGQAVAAAFYGDHMNPEGFTSQGPSTFLFDAAGNPLGSPEVRNTPDYAAVDGTNNTFFGSDSEGDSFPNFFGTSAAAPHAAALAALIRDANPGFTPSQVYSAMSSTADDITSSGAGFDNVTGAGLLNVYDALYPVQSTTLNNTFTEGFESGVLGDMWETHTNGPSRILVTTSNGPNTGSYHSTMDTFAGFGFGLNELILHLDLRNGSNMMLNFDQREWGDTDQIMPTTFSGSGDYDGVALSVDGGTTWYSLISLTGLNSTSTYTTQNINLSLFASTEGLALGADVRIKFQQYDNFPITSDGFAFDNIQVTSDTPTAVTLAEFSAGPQAGSRLPLLAALLLFAISGLGAWVFIRRRSLT